MGIFSKRPKESQLVSMLQNLQSCKDAFLVEMHDLAVSEYKDEQGNRSNSRIGSSFLAQDELARKELILFLDDFMVKNLDEITALNQATPKEWEWILNPLMKALQTAIIDAASGKNWKINTQQSQRGELPISQKVVLILPQVSAAIDGMGLPPSSYVDWPSYKIADHLLLAAIIRVLIGNVESKGIDWLRDSSWFLSTLYSAYVQWSFREGPYKLYMQSKN